MRVSAFCAELAIALFEIRQLQSPMRVSAALSPWQNTCTAMVR